jgi:hypothetical protein
MTTTAEFRTLVAEERAAVVEINANGATAANEARLVAATCASGMMTASSSSSHGVSKPDPLMRLCHGRRFFDRGRGMGGPVRR